jgi:diketogulonate reductase-like aldo/keto reductase
VGQYELHPWLPHDDIVTWCRAHGVIVQAWSPLVRSERSSEPVLKEIGDKYGKSWAQVLVRWSLQKGYVPLPKSVTPSRIEENADVWDFELNEADMARLHFPDSYAPCSWDPTVSND